MWYIQTAENTEAWPSTDGKCHFIGIGSSIIIVFFRADSYIDKVNRSDDGKHFSK